MQWSPLFICVITISTDSIAAAAQLDDSICWWARMIIPRNRNYWIKRVGRCGGPIFTVLFVFFVFLIFLILNACPQCIVAAVRVLHFNPKTKTKAMCRQRMCRQRMCRRQGGLCQLGICRQNMSSASPLIVIPSLRVRFNEYFVSRLPHIRSFLAWRFNISALCDKSKSGMEILQVWGKECLWP